MARYLDEGFVRRAPAPADGKPYLIYYDSDSDKAVKGFGLRVTRNGARAFVLNYRFRGLERRYTIGSAPEWKVVAAREEAKRLKREIDGGRDPMGERHAERDAPTVRELAQRYQEEHGATKRARTLAEDKSLFDNIILPELGAKKAMDVRREDVERMHRKITALGRKVRANRALALTSNLFVKAIHWGLCADNPAKGVERNREQPRHRYLTEGETVRLMKALTKHRTKPSANAVMLLLLTGARRGEVLMAKWDQFDLEAGAWTKPAHFTKQKRMHRIRLSAVALALLRQMNENSKDAHLFPGRGENDAQGDLKRFWGTVRKDAHLPDLRIHDLRHSYASILASEGMSLPTIGALLGHTRTETTARYAHLLDAPLKRATDRVGKKVMAAIEKSGGGDLIPFPKERRE